MEEERRNRNFDTGEITYGSVFFDTLVSKLTGKTASKLASKAAEKLIEKGAEKVGEKTGEVLGEKIHEKFSSKGKKEPPTAVVATQPTEPMGELGGDKWIKSLQEEWKKREKEDGKKERKTINDLFAAEFL